MLQMKPQSGPAEEIRYNPARDITHLLPALIKAVGERLEDGAFAPMDKWLAEAGVTMDDLGEAAGAYFKFVAAGVQSPTKTMTEVLEESGWENVRWEAQVATMYYVGAMLSGSFYKGAKDANSPEYRHVQFFVADMAEAGKAFERFTSRPWWKRWLMRKSKMLKRLIHRSEGIYREF